jgi:hypothetical protein
LVFYRKIHPTNQERKMKQHRTIPALIMTLAAILLAFIAIGCDLNPPATEDTIIDLIPEFSSESTELARSVIPSDMSVSDAFYTIFAPPLTRFAAAPAAFKVGKAIVVDIFGNDVTLKTSEDDGVIVFSGTITEKDGADADVQTGEIEIRYDPVASTFSYTSSILVADPSEVLESGPTMNAYVMTEIPETTINTNHSFLARFRYAAFIGLADDIQYMDAGELYSGPGDSGDWVVGFGQASFSSIKGLAAKDLTIPELVDVTGKPVSNSAFLAAREALATYWAGLDDFLIDNPDYADNGEPMLGYRISADAGKTTRLFNETVSIDGSTSVYAMTDMGGSGQLTDSNGATIAFNGTESGDNFIADRVLSNVEKLISGFPAEAWRMGSLLVDICEAKTDTFVDDRVP